MCDRYYKLNDETSMYKRVNFLIICVINRISYVCTFLFVVKCLLITFTSFLVKTAACLTFKCCFVLIYN